MNIHVPQSERAIVEAKTLMMPQNMIISGQGNSPIIGIVQNGVISAYLLTKIHNNKYTMVEKQIFYDSIMSTFHEKSSTNVFDRFNTLAKRAYPFYKEYIDFEYGKYKYKDFVPGRVFISILFPEDFSYNKDGVIIINGILVDKSKFLTKKDIGNSPNSIIQILYKNYSPDICLDFLSEIQFLTDRWLPTYGFSVGIDDCLLANDKAYEDVEKIVSEIPAKLNLITETDPELRENATLKILNSASNKGDVIANKFMNKGQNNSFFITATSKAKGSVLNITQITSYLGNQTIHGSRFEPKMNFGKRTLSCFPIEAEDDAPENRGFIKTNYMCGLTPSEYFFHSAAGRTGVIDTALGTGESGYNEKKMCRKVENLKIYYDGTVRNSNNHIVSFLYGDDGMDPQKLYNCNRKYIKYPFFIDVEAVASSINNKYLKNHDQVSSIRVMNDKEIKTLLKHINVSSSGLKSNIVRNCNKTTHSTLKKILQNVYVYEDVIPELCRQISFKYEMCKAPYGEMVGLLAAVALTEPITQLTLNSIEWNEELLLMINNEYKIVKIGYWIDTCMNEANKYDIVEIPENRTQYLELINIGLGDVYVPSCDMNGNMEWSKVTAITKHLPVGQLVKIQTRTGRQVTATQAKSFLIWDDKLRKLKEMNGSDIKIGDKVPVSNKICIHSDYWYNKEHNDIGLDEIVSIEYVESKYEHVYDLSVPSTLNFAISNGINMRDTFHSVGSSDKDVTTGIPRLNELLNITKKPQNPVSTLYINDEKITTFMNMLNEIDDSYPIYNDIKNKIYTLYDRYCKKIVEIKLGDLVDTIDVLTLDPNIKTSPLKDIIETTKSKTELWWEELFDKIQLAKNSITRNDETELDGDGPAFTPVSEDTDSEVEETTEKSDESINSDQDKTDDSEFVIRVSLSPKKMFNYCIDMEVITNQIRVAFKEVDLIIKHSPNSDGIIDIYLDLQYIRQYIVDKTDYESDDFNVNYLIIKDIMIKYIQNIYISGITGIKKAFPKENENGEWYISTRGSNLKDCINSDLPIDTYKITCDDVNVIYELYGIEAARSFFITEFEKIISFDGTTVNKRHIQMLVDSMTYTGSMTSVRRDGISREEGPITKVMFEKSVENMVKAAYMNETDDLQSVASSTMFSTKVQIGTGVNQIIPA